MSKAFEVAELAEDLDEDRSWEAVEPCLKYKSIEHDLCDITSADFISCMAAHEKFIAVGTQLGRVHLLDHNGFHVENGIYRVHSATVNAISISDQGYCIASCSEDGLLVIYNLSLSVASEVSNFYYPIKVVALAPDFEKSNNLVIGYNKIYLLSKGVFTKAKQEELAKVNGLVRTVEWRGEFILWADDKCICVYDTCDHRPITFIQFSSSPNEVTTPLTVCSLCWCTENCFLIGLGQSIRICQILDRNNNSHHSLHSSRSSLTYGSSQNLSSIEHRIGLPSRYVEIIYQINMNDILIHGVSRHQACILLLSSSIANGLSKSEYTLSVLDIDIDSVSSSTSPNQKYEEIYHEKLSINSTAPHTIGLELLCAHELTIDDRIDWFLGNNLFSKGLEVAQEHPRLLSRHTVQSVGITYIDHLLSERHFNGAGILCSYVLSTKEAWEEYVQKFFNIGHLEAIVPYLPVSGEEKSIKLNSSTYESILIDYMNRMPIEFVQLLAKWCKLCVVNIGENFIRTLLDCIEQCSSLSDAVDLSKLDVEVQALYRGLAISYEQMGSYEQAINILVRLRDSEVFMLLKRNSIKLRDRRLVDILKDHLIYFMELDATKAINMLMDHIDQVSIDYIVNQLNSDSMLLYQVELFLNLFIFKFNDDNIFLIIYQSRKNFPNHNSVYTRSPQIIGSYLTLLISLYIKFCRSKLLPLLRSTDRYPLSEALNLCERAKLVPETVYLLTRVGRRHDALQLIMTRGGEDSSFGELATQEQRQAVAAAKSIEYCREEDGIHSKNRRSFHRRRSINNPNFGKDGDEDEGDENAGELWQQVILFAADKPAFICALLQNAGCEGLDSRLLLRKISPNMTIPGLRDALVKLMHDYKIQIELQQSCSRILSSDMHHLFLRVIKMQMKGIRVNSNVLSSVECTICLQPILNSNGQSWRSTNQLKCDDNRQGVEESHCSWTIFQCNHICHEDCLTNFTGIILTSTEFKVRN
ncbi:Vacuolar protein sorting-associated protein 41 like [Schistosoma japonicum]|nr:Vacuolar protein sorting-associated protein 41 like [Schistosoma japonicum]